MGRSTRLSRDDTRARIARRKHPPADAAKLIEDRAADGFSMVGIAAALTVSRDILNAWFNENPELKEALERGRERERQALHNMLYRAAMEDGNTTAAMFLLKSRHGYREGDQSETANRVSIEFKLPGALSPDQFAVIEHDRDDRTQRLSATPAVRA